MKNQSSIYKLKKLKLQRLIPYYEQLKIKAVKNQQWELAATYRYLQKEYEEELLRLKIGL